MDDHAVEELQGGVNRVVRRGGTVVRPMGRHSRAVHQMLVHLENVGFDGAPRLLAVDADAQTETLTFLDGEVADYPLPPAFTSDAAMRSAAQLLRRLHDAMDTFTASPDVEWFLPTVEPAEIIVHGDFAPYNCVIREGLVIGVFDFDTAHPAPRISDVAYAAYRWVPLTAPTNLDGFGSIDDQVRRLPEFCAAYGVSDLEAVVDSAHERLVVMVDNIRQLAANGHASFQQHLADEHDLLYLRDADFIKANRGRLARSPGD